MATSVPARATAGSRLTPAAAAGSPLAMPLLLLAGFGVAVVLRSVVGGPAVARSVPAGLVFAVGLLVLTAVAVPRSAPRLPAQPVPARRLLSPVVAGVLGAAVLCVPAALHAVGPVGPAVSRSGTGFLGWALVVTVVASAEEAFLRGALFRHLERFGVVPAIAVPALAFAALHVPLYGWGAAPLDLAVGVWLGALRASAGTWIAPAIAHVVADWAAWWLV